MIPLTCLKGEKIAVFGLGKSGLSTCLAIMAGGGRVFAWDDASAMRERARKESVAISDLSALNWKKEGIKTLVLAPGVPFRAPKPHWVVEKAEKAGAEIIGDIELFSRERRKIAPGSPFVCVTGTNGKSTTSTMISHLLTCAQRDVQLGGNIGEPILSLEPPSESIIHVIETSSFQIDLAPSLDPSVSVLLNVRRDHLDRHGTFEAYAFLKERAIMAADLAVLAIDDFCAAAIADRRLNAGKPTLRVSGSQEMSDGVFVSRQRVVFARGGRMLEIADIANLSALQGVHNAQNAAAAIAAVLGLGVSSSSLWRAFRSFVGLPHRMERVGASGSVLFVNDSKATNSEAALNALRCFEKNIYWIIGGKSKEDDFDLLRPYFDRVKKAYLIGEAAEALSTMLSNNDVSHINAGILDIAVYMAYEDARSLSDEKSVILLSPACASYDQYQNYVFRGEHFRQLVSEFPGFAAEEKSEKKRQVSNGTRRRK